MMEFHKYQDYFDTVRPERRNRVDFIKSLERRFKANTTKEINPGGTRCGMELHWIENRRPFYNVYPAITEALKKTRTDFDLATLPHINPLAICFPVGKEVVFSQCGNVARDFNVKSMLINVLTGVEELESEFGIQWFIMGILHTDAKDEDYEFRFFATSSSQTEREPDELVSFIVGLSMIAKDSEFVEPMLLSRDRNRIGLTDEQKAKAIHRARRRGCFGFEVGKDIDASPHYRRPHFAIRWTGKNHATPKLRPVKGAIVKRSKLLPIPTGYLDKKPVNTS